MSAASLPSPGPVPAPALEAAFAAFDALWEPRIVTRVNEYDVKIAKVAGEFVEHVHEDTDEFFLVLAGHLTIELRDTAVSLPAGSLWVVPAGLPHRPVAEPGTRLLLFEPRGTRNTGDADDSGTTGEELPA